MIVYKWILLAILAGIIAPVQAATEGLQLYGVQGVFLDANSGKVHPDFVKALDIETAAAQFASAFLKTFPDAVANIDDRNKRRTFAVSLQVVRASRYEIKKPDGTVDLYLPITASIYFTNVMTGEVLYSVTKTDIKQQTVAVDKNGIPFSRIQNLFVETFNELVSDLLHQAQSQFKPSVIKSTAKKDVNGLFVLDGGQEQGIVKGDTLLDKDSNELTVVFSADNYSVAYPGLGKVKVGSSFSKFSNQTIAEIKKPKVIVLIGKEPKDFPGSVITQLFSDSLGSKAPLSIIQVNKNFANVLASVSNKTRLSQEGLRQRELPDFFIRLNVAEPFAYELPTNLKHKTRRYFESHVFGELIDRSGRVLYANYGENKIVDEVTAGISFDDNARREIVIKNSLLDLAEKISKELKFKRLELPITSVSGDNIEIRDDSGVLTKGKSVTVFNHIGNVEGVKGEIIIPTWNLNITESLAGKGMALKDLPVTAASLPISIKDTITMDGVESSKSVSRQRFGYCGATVKLGAINMPLYEDASVNGFERLFIGVFFVKNFGAQINDLVGKTSGFKSDVTLTDSEIDLCLEPVYRIDSAEKKCTDDKSCTEIFNVRLTYRIKKGDEVIVKQGFESKMTSTSVRSDVSEVMRDQLTQSDLLDEAIKMSSKIMENLNKQSFQ